MATRGRDRTGTTLDSALSCAKIAEIRIDDTPSRADVDWLDEQINAFNVAATGYDDGLELAIFERDAAGGIVAGLYGATWGGCAQIDLLWIAEPLRGRGLGREMLDLAESEAQRRGCSLIVVSSHGFQAPEFYRRCGYEVLAAIEGKPRGSREVHLAKRLVPTTEAVVPDR